MKIAHVVGTFPPDIGGMGRVAFDECQGLAGRGHDVTVFTMRYAFAKGSVMSVPFQVERLCPFIRLGDAGCVPQLVFKLKNFDLIHLHYPWYGGAEWVLLASKLRSQKYVVTYHMHARPAEWHKQLIQKLYDPTLGKLIIKNSEKVLVVDRNYFAEQPFSLYVTAEKVVELPNPINTEIFQPQSVVYQAEGLAEWPDKKIILFVGNLMPVKRLDLVIEALTKLPSYAVLLVAGGGYEEARYKTLVVERNLNERVRFAGRISDQEQLVRYYNAAWCTVVPSDAESFSLVIAESLASGTPVVASDIPGMRGRVEDGQDGYLFQVDSREDLTEKMQKMLALTPDERKQMGERGRAKVEIKYSLDGHVNHLESIYQHVL